MSYCRTWRCVREGTAARSCTFPTINANGSVGAAGASTGHAGQGGTCYLDVLGETAYSENRNEKLVTEISLHHCLTEGDRRELFSLAQHKSTGRKNIPVAVWGRLFF